MVFCHACGKANDTGERVGRRDSCRFCGADLHVCLNCRHYDPSAYNECRETQADRVLEKDRSNFCDYFAPGEEPAKTPARQADPAKAKLDALFKKKP
jgi:hypothetical protein